MHVTGRTLRTIALSTALASLQAHAQPESRKEDGTKTVRVARIESPPVIDGVLDDDVWQLADVITDFHQTRPGDGTPTSEPTELYLLYDDDAFYIGARMYDSEPELIAAPTIRHGQGLGSDDRLVVIIDPFNTGRTGYRFETNANGIRHDALYNDISSFESEWTVIWDTAASIDENGWNAELAIPFKTLPFDPGTEDWGFNFGRGIRRRGEEMAWVSRNRTYNPSILGIASGFTGMDQGMGLDIVPSISVNEQRSFDPGVRDSNIDPSLDVFYRLTPSLNASLTINTDFSATEVDNRQVNLTRFNLFFPEKRDFFLNDADLFEFGRIGAGGNNNSNRATSRPSRENARPFFSRRVGLSGSGAPVDLEYGGKLSGRVGRWNVGTLGIRQDDFEAVNATNLFVGRITANVLDESSIGMIITEGDPQSDLDNSVVGADFRFLNSRLPGGRVFEADAWYQQSETTGLDGDDSAYGLSVNMPNNSGIRAGAAVKEVERNFNPAMGYVNRSNIRDMTANAGFTHYFDSDFLQSAFFGVDVQRIELLDGGLQSEVLRTTLIDATTNSRDGLEASYISNKEAVGEPFVIYRDQAREVVIEPGNYSFDEQLINISTGTQRKFSGSLSYQVGDFYNGERTNIGGSFSWKQSRNFIMSLSYDWNDIELPQGDFITRLTSLSTQVAFSSTLYWVSLIQYDNVSEQLGVNTRLQWIPRAGQEGFIVLNHNVQDLDKDNSFSSVYSDISIKFKYTFRF